MSVLSFWRKKSHFNNDDFDFPIFVGLNCFAKNIIYIIEYKDCGDKYVGETSRCLRNRTFNHISDIHKNKDGPVSRHFDIWFGPEENTFFYPIEQKILIRVMPKELNLLGSKDNSIGLKL